MKKLLGLIACTCLSAVLVFGTTGCPDKTKDKTVKVTDKKTVTETTTDKEKKKVTEDKTVTETVKKWTVKSPADVTVTQGETVAVHVDITRDKFMDPVDVKFDGLPDGVTVPEKDWTIAKDATSAKFTLKAAADAKPVIDQKVTVKAMSGTATQEATFKVTVKKAETKKAATDDTKPATDTKKPATDTKKPATDDKKPATDTKKPATDSKNSSSLSSTGLDFYALLNERFLTPVCAVRSVQVFYPAGRNEPFVTA
jgi:hypothetical protein